MATAKSMKIQAEIDKVKAKISEQQARLKELEQKKLEAENSEIVDIVRGMSIPLAELLTVIFVIHNGTRSAVNNIGQLLLCHAAGFSCPLDGEPYIVKIKASFISFYLHNIT